MRKFLIALGAAGALLTLAGTAGAQASVRPLATPACGFNCFNLSSLAYGKHMIQSAVVPGDNGSGGHVGDKINLANATDSSPNEDFTGGLVGTVAQLCGENQLSPYICNNYGPTSEVHGDFPVYESDWAPYGNESGLCVGVGRPAFNNENVTLRPCGVNATTFWVADLSHSHIGYTPFLNGADNTFTHPLVLTVVATKHGKRLRVARLNLLDNNFIANEQMFTMSFGVEV